MNARTCEVFQLRRNGSPLLVGHWSFSHRPSKSAVVFIHGFGSVRSGEKSQALEEECSRRGWTFCALDFRGHGESSGKMTDLTCSSLLEDLNGMMTFLEGRGIMQVCLVGSSMGGWAASWFAYRYPIGVVAMVLLAPAFHFPHRMIHQLSPEEMALWQKTGRFHFKGEQVEADLGYSLVADAEDYSLSHLLESWATPTLIIHGMKDQVIPFQESVQVCQEIQFPYLELRLFKNGNHRLSGFKGSIAQSACDFFRPFMESC